MQVLTWMKILVIGMVAAVAGYVVYQSDWFQKKYIYPFPYQGLVYQYALENNLDPFLVAAVIRTESKFRPGARSPKGAMGLMQMMPDTAKWVAEQNEIHSFTLEQLEQPDVSIKMGTWYLSSLQQEFKHNELLMLSAYNGGRGNVKQWMRQYGWNMQFTDIQQIPFKETREYAVKVLRSKQRYQELYGK